MPEQPDRGRMRRSEISRLSRTVAHALRHEPWVYELEMDDDGWVPVTQLLHALRNRLRARRDLTRDDLAEMIRRSDRRRYETDGDRIRALYGHSLRGRLRKEEAVPPRVLYHGTSPGALGAIRAEGLRPMERQYVHLSTTAAAARQVGRRKAPRPVVLLVRARDAHGDGVAFYRGNSHVWLADHVPPAWMRPVMD